MAIRRRRPWKMRRDLDVVSTRSPRTLRVLVTWIASVALVTPGILPFALRAMLRMFKIVPDDFVFAMTGIFQGFDNDNWILLK